MALRQLAGADPDPHGRALKLSMVDAYESLLTTSGCTEEMIRAVRACVDGGDTEGLEVLIGILREAARREDDDGEGIQ